MEEFVGKVLFGLGALGLMAWGAKSASEARKNTGLAMTKLAKLTPDDIRDEMIDRAVQNSVDKQVSKVRHDLQMRANETLDKRVNACVDLAYASVHGKVDARVDDAIQRIDMAKIERDIRAAGQEEIREIVRDKLDDLVDDFRDELKDEFIDGLFYGRRSYRR